MYELLYSKTDPYYQTLEAVLCSAIILLDIQGAEGVPILCGTFISTLPFLSSKPTGLSLQLKKEHYLS